jgi:sterol desaturase/sphingolipid hydroxylase (fatty acid hydroxylase superfamily)
MEKAIVYAFPVFGVLILVEYGLGLARGRCTYRVNDAIANLSQGILSQVTLVLTNVFHLGIYTLVFTHVALLRAPAFWESWAGWIAAIVLVDFCAYWAHRCSHKVAILWAAHVVHHQSQTFNFSTALRQESAYPILGFLFYLPLALLGMPPAVFAVAWLAVLLYQVWIHTELVGRLGWFDRVFASPSNHRVHHALNDAYIDRNFGGLLIIWDRLFGTFVPEGAEACIYGTRPLLQSWDPIGANLVVYRKLLHDARLARRWSDKLRVWFMPPGWRPADVARGDPRPAFDIAAVRVYDPALGASALAFACAQFLLLVVAAAAFLWFAEDLPLPLAGLLVGGFAAALWILGRVLQGGLGPRRALAADAALLVVLASALPWLSP